MSPEDISSLATRLSTVLEVGNVEEAKTIAATLAEQKVKVQIEVLQPYNVEHEEPEISVKVYVEDKDTSGASIMMNIRPSFTVGMLKKMMQKDYGFPEVIQKWIIGSIMPKDTDLLKACGIKGPGCSLFLYLVSCRSVGLTKEAYVQQQAQERDPPNENRDSAERNNTSDDNSEFISENLSNRVMPQDAPGVDQTPTYPPAVPKRERHKPDFHINQRRPPPISTNPRRKLTTVPKTQAPQSARDNDGLSIQSTQAVLTALLDTSEVPAVAKPSSKRNASQGWTCPQCTFLNTPTRPGCAMCTMSRPVEYKIPDDFTVPEEEQARLNREQQLDLQAQNSFQVRDGDQSGRQEARANPGDILCSYEQMEQLLNNMLDRSPNSVQTEQNHPFWINDSATTSATERLICELPFSPVMESVATEHSESDDDNTDNDNLPTMH